MKPTLTLTRTLNGTAFTREEMKTRTFRSRVLSDILSDINGRISEEGMNGSTR